METIDAIFYVLVLIMSVVVHEVSHGYAASRQGDETAALSGRLTLNPLKHLDPIGSVAVPFLLIVSGAHFVFGWAKPVPYNPNNLRDKKWGTIIVAAAGLIANAVIAICFAFIIRILILAGLGTSPMISFLATVVIVNLVLMLFNLVPIPPLDGSKIVFALLPPRAYRFERFLEQYSLILLIAFIFFLWKFMVPLIYILFHILTGLGT